MRMAPCSCCKSSDKNTRGNRTTADDERLRIYVPMHGEGFCGSLPKSAGLSRCGKSCRLRWTNHLRPRPKRGGFAEDEDELIIKLHALLGDKWSLIAGRLPGRTDNEIKNYWNVHLKRLLLSRGVDPQTHRPIQQLHRHFSPRIADLTSVPSQSEHDVSDAASGSTEEHPKLNLELCIGTLPSGHAAAAAAATHAVHGDWSDEVKCHGRTSVKEELKGLIKPVCHRVGQVMPRTLFLLR